MNKPTIVINAYQRPKSLSRLLESIEKANIPDQVDIWFSLEYGAVDEVVELVKSFNWKKGKKQIIRQKEKLGLVGHFLACGDLTSKLGTIIYLEDDLFVGPSFYHYAMQVLDAYENDGRIAGFSLNALWFNGYLHLPFKPIFDGNPVFFLQVAWYQGQVYTANQWQLFRQWLASNKGLDSDVFMHESMINFKLSDDWFPIKTRYLVETARFYCFPREAHVVNFGDAGTHFLQKTNFFMTELALEVGTAGFKPFSESLAVYDSFFELLPDRVKRLNTELASYDFEMDLNGLKDLAKIKSKFLISSRSSSVPILKFALEMRPQEMSILYNRTGDFFTLAEANTFEENNRNRENKQFLRFEYFHRHKLRLKQQLKFLLKRIYHNFVKV